MKFSRKLLRKRVRRHINITSITLNVQSVRQSCPRMRAVTYDSSGQPCHRFLGKIIPDRLQCGSNTGQTAQRTFTLDGLNDVDSRKDEPAVLESKSV